MSASAGWGQGPGAGRLMVPGNGMIVKTDTTAASGASATDYTLGGYQTSAVTHPSSWTVSDIQVRREKCRVLEGIARRRVSCWLVSMLRWDALEPTRRQHLCRLPVWNPGSALTGAVRVARRGVQAEAGSGGRLTMAFTLQLDASHNPTAFPIIYTMGPTSNGVLLPHPVRIPLSALLQPAPSKHACK